MKRAWRSQEVMYLRRLSTLYRIRETFPDVMQYYKSHAEVVTARQGLDSCSSAVVVISWCLDGNFICVQWKVL
jgi:hypothetical protein